MCIYTLYTYDIAEPPNLLIEVMLELLLLHEDLSVSRGLVRVVILDPLRRRRHLLETHMLQPSLVRVVILDPLRRRRHLQRHARL